MQKHAGFVRPCLCPAGSEKPQPGPGKPGFRATSPKPDCFHMQCLEGSSFPEDFVLPCANLHGTQRGTPTAGSFQRHRVGCVFAVSVCCGQTLSGGLATTSAWSWQGSSTSPSSARCASFGRCIGRAGSTLGLPSVEAQIVG